MYGLLGTALAQALVAVVGFLIAGVPAVALLGVATFLFSLIPVGPPLIWGGAAIWLFRRPDGLGHLHAGVGRAADQRRG
jgi:predicted PurR-regulated permease PerM